MTVPNEPGLPSDKLVAPVNAPRGTPTPVGVQPGVSGNIVLAQYVVVFGTSGGVFIYAGSPGPGNPPLYSLGNVVQDPYGNPVKPGIWAGQPGSNQVGMQASPGNNFAAQFFIVPGDFEGDGLILAISAGTGKSVLQVSGPQNPAPNNDRVVLNLLDNLTAGVGAVWQLAYVDTAGTSHAAAQGGYFGTQLFTVSALTTVTPGTGTGTGNVAIAETWHTASLLNSWAGSGGVGGVFYRLVLPGLVEVIGDIINTTATGNSIVATLGTGYQPSTAQNHPAAWNNPAASNSATPPWVSVSTGGNIQLTGIEAANKEIFFHIFIPLGTL